MMLRRQPCSLKAFQPITAADLKAKKNHVDDKIPVHSVQTKSTYISTPRSFMSGVSTLEQLCTCMVGYIYHD